LKEAAFMTQIGAEYPLAIVDVALPSGYGVARIEGMVVFVPGTVPGDTALTKIVKLDKHFAYGEVVRLEETSPDRLVGEGCSRYGECGGCELQALAYERQLEVKENHLTQVLKRIGNVDLRNVVISPIVPSVDRYFYRSKVEFTFGEEQGETVIGLRKSMGPFRPDGGHVVPVGDCRLFSPVAERILPLVAGLVRSSNLKAYDGSKRKGAPKRFTLREAKGTNEIMANLIIERHGGAPYGEWARDLAAAVPEVQSIYVTSGDQPRLAHGRAYINERLAGLTFRVYPFSFFQPNPRTAEELYRRIIPLAEIQGQERILGLYCGAGTLELFLAAYANVKEITGVDSSGESIACARENGAINKIGNVVFLKEEVEHAAARFQGKGVDIVVTDPPRAGMSKETLAAVKALKTGKLVYISCNPSTLARDLRMLRPDYLPKEIIPFDFFPHTGHFEVLTLLERQ
jgi:23S rRNA (uracil1939-C5)-methyltransferase